MYLEWLHDLSAQYVCAFRNKFRLENNEAFQELWSFCFNRVFENKNWCIHNVFLCLEVWLFTSICILMSWLIVLLRMLCELPRRECFCHLSGCGLLWAWDIWTVRWWWPAMLCVSDLLLPVWDKVPLWSQWVQVWVHLCLMFKVCCNRFCFPERLSCLYHAQEMCACPAKQKVLR